MEFTLNLSNSFPLTCRRKEVRLKFDKLDLFLSFISNSEAQKQKKVTDRKIMNIF